jgi:NADH-quinone oxidoreductase subunit J
VLIFAVSPVFIILAILTSASALAAVSLRNLVHCALALTVAFAGLAALYLQLHAQFVGFAQLLVYIGAVAILIVFAILLTRGAEPAGIPILSKSWCLGGGVSLAVFAIFARVVLTSKALSTSAPPVAEVSVRQIGDQLMTRYVLPLEVLGLLLTAALIGAAIIAMADSPRQKPGVLGTIVAERSAESGNGEAENSRLAGNPLQTTASGSAEVQPAGLEPQSREAGA